MSARASPMSNANTRRRVDGYWVADATLGYDINETADAAPQRLQPVRRALCRPDRRRPFRPGSGPKRSRHSRIPAVSAAMLVAVPAVLPPDQLSEVRRLDRGGRLGRRQGHGRAAVGARQAQPPARRRRTRARRRRARSSSRRSAPTACSCRRRCRSAIFPPLFNRYDADAGHGFGNHVDNAIRYLPDGAGRIRTDLSATLFLVRPRRL